MFKRAVAVLVTGLMLGVFTVAAEARPKKVKGSFTASAKPLPSGCGDGLEGVHKVSHPFTAPFAGWFKARATFEGDWDLGLMDTSGDRLASSEYQANWEVPEERIDYYLEAGQEVVIMVCNYLSQSDAQVEYSLTASPAWSTPVPKKKVTRVEELSYVAPAIATPDFWVICHVGMELGCTATDPRPTDRFVSIEILDDLGGDVSAEFYQYNGETYLREEYFCTSTEEPIPISPGADFVGVSLFLGPCGDGSPAMPSKGKVVMEFTSK